MSSIFTRIINWEIPSFKLYEDEHTYAFLDIFPQVPGHTLIVPKIEIDHFADVGEPYYSAIFQTAKKLAPAIQSATNCTRVCALFLWFDVSHCHYHLIPAFGVDDVNISKNPQATTEDLKAMQEKILSILKANT